MHRQEWRLQKHLAVNEENRRQVMEAGHHNKRDIVRPQTRHPSLRDKYIELKNFEVEVTNIFLT